MATFFASCGYELENAWTPTGDPQKLTKDEIKSINRAVVRERELEDGTKIKNVIFFMKKGKPRSFKLSPYGANHSNGTELDLNSIAIQEITNDNGELKYTVTGDEL